MDFFHWNPGFELGVAEIDTQHRRLVTLINELSGAMAEGGLLRDTRAVFEELREYAVMHFRDEECLLHASSLSDEEKAAHVRAHQRFVEQTQALSAHPRLHQAEVSQQVLEFLTGWLVTHILGQDRRLASSGDLPPAAPYTPAALLAEIPSVEQVLLAALNETERRFRLISDNLPVLIWVADAQGRRSFHNQTYRDFVGVADASMLNDDWQAHVHPDDRRRYRHVLETLTDHPVPLELEYRLRAADGHYHWFLEKIQPRGDAIGGWQGLVAAATDITAIKQAETRIRQANQSLEQEVARRTAQLEALIMTDPLTGLGNRRMLAKWLADEASRAHRFQRPLSVIFLDIDHFKAVNDQHGHAAGDAALVALAQVLRHEVRDCDLIGRYGGEEFVVLLPETDAAGALVLAERMRRAVAGHIVPALQRPVTISAGIAGLLPAETSDALLRRCDRALYDAKRAGRNRCHVAGT